MKKIFLILTASVLSFTYSCSNDDNEAPIEGNWMAEKMTVTGSIVYNGLPLPVSQVKDNSCTKESFLNLNADHSGSLLVKDDTSGTCESLIQESFTYSYNSDNKIITVTDNGTSEDVKVKSLSSTALVIEKDIEYSTTQGNFTGKVEINFKK